MAFEQAIQPGDWAAGRQFDADGHAIAYDPTQLDTIKGVQQKANYGPYVQQLLANGTISEDRVLSGSAVAGSQGQRWFPGNDGNIYLVDGTGQRPVTRIPMSNIDPRTGKDKVGSVSDFLDPNTGALTGTGKADFAKIDPGEMIALATIAAISGGAALTGLGAIGGAAAGGGVGGGGAVGGAGGFIGEGAASGIGAWDGALASAPSWAAPAAGTAAMGAGADGFSGASSAFNPAMDSQLASTQLGLTGADTASAGIPGVTLSNVPANGISGLLGGSMSNIGGSGLTSGLSSLFGGSGTGASSGFNWGSLIGPALNAVGGAVSANAAKDAASTQAQSAKDANDLLWKMYQQQRTDQEPFRQAGVGATNRLQELLGTGGNAAAPDYGSAAKDFTAADYTANQDPGYQFQLDQGNKSLASTYGQKGNFFSGAAMKGIDRYNQDYASTGYQNAYNRYQTNRAAKLNPLQSLAGMGQTSANTLSSAAGNYGTSASNNITAAGNASAAGQVGSSNAWSNALSGAWNTYQQNQLMNSLLRT